MRRLQLAVTVLTLVFASLSSTRLAEAQVIVRPWARPYYRVPGYGKRNAAANGMANLIRAQSQAAVNYEQARSIYLDNRQKWAQNYYKNREEHQAHVVREQERTKHSADSLTAAAKSDVPAPLGADALDPATGRITWPAILRGPDFAAPRTQLDGLFALRATSSFGEANAGRIHAAALEMTARLRDRIGEIPPKPYLAARKFLDSLDYTSQAPAG